MKRWIVHVIVLFFLVSRPNSPPRSVSIASGQRTTDTNALSNHARSLSRIDWMLSWIRYVRSSLIALNCPLRLTPSIPHLNIPKWCIVANNSPDRMPKTSTMLLHVGHSVMGHGPSFRQIACTPFAINCSSSMANEYSFTVQRSGRPWPVANVSHSVLKRPRSPIEVSGGERLCIWPQFPCLL